MRRKKRSFPPKPVQLGKEYDVVIEEISRMGQGIARIQGFVIFVPDTKPRDRVRIKITRISSRFAEAEVVNSRGRFESEEHARIERK